MKKNIFLSGLIILGFTLPSCKKNFTCTCDLVPSKQKYIYRYDALKGEADETCKDQDKAIKMADSTGTSSCVLSKD